MDDVVEPAAADFALPRILAALADPQRLAAVRYVARNGESWCAQVMEEAGLAMTKSTFSHHLRILREAGVLTKRIQGTRGYTRLRKDDLDRRFPGLMDSIIDADASRAADVSSLLPARPAGRRHRAPPAMPPPRQGCDGRRACRTGTRLSW
jgi:DNA-binding transcriptional ArsR family regulator